MESRPEGTGHRRKPPVHLSPAASPRVPRAAHTAQRDPELCHPSDQPTGTRTGLAEFGAAKSLNLNLCAPLFTNGETEAQLGVKERTSVPQPVDSWGSQGGGGEPGWALPLHQEGTKGRKWRRDWGLCHLVLGGPLGCSQCRGRVRPRGGPSRSLGAPHILPHAGRGGPGPQQGPGDPPSPFRACLLLL